MPTQHQTDEQEVSLYEHIEISAERFALRLDDIAGLDNLKTQLQRTYYPGLHAGEPAIHAPLLYLRGPGSAGVTRLARAVAGQLHEKGYKGGLLNMAKVRQVKPHRRAIREPETAQLLDSLREEAPAVLVLDQIPLDRIDDQGLVDDTLRDIRQTGAEVACIVTDSTDQYEHPGHSQDMTGLADFTFDVPEPDTTRRTRLLKATVTAILERTSFRLSEQVEFNQLAQETAGLGRDKLERVAKRAGQRAFARNGLEATITHNDIETPIDNIKTNQRDDQDPTSWGPGADVTSVFTPEKPEVSFEDIGGMDETIARVREILTFPDTFSDIYETAGWDTGHSLLLYGPPGTGKTLLSKAIAAESSRSFFAVNGPELKNMYFGETERRLRELFEAADVEAPSLIFFDEFDAIAGARSSYRNSAMRSVVTTLLTEMDGLPDRGDIFMVAATNRPDALDDAVVRPGRIEERIECPPPDRAGQAEIFAIHSEGLPCAPDVTPQWFAKTSPEGITGADIEQICKRAATSAMRTVQDKSDVSLRVTRADVTAALKTVRPTTDQHGYAFM